SLARPVRPGSSPNLIPRVTQHFPRDATRKRCWVTRGSPSSISPERCGRANPTYGPAVRDAARRLGTRDLSDCDVYSTATPCAMCQGALYWARVRRVFTESTLEQGL